MQSPLVPKSPVWTEKGREDESESRVTREPIGLRSLVYPDAFPTRVEHLPGGPMLTLSSANSIRFRDATRWPPLTAFLPSPLRHGHRHRRRQHGGAADAAPLPPHDPHSGHGGPGGGSYNARGISQRRRQPGGGGGGQTEAGPVEELFRLLEVINIKALALCPTRAS